MALIPGFIPSSVANYVEPFAAGYGIRLPGSTSGAVRIKPPAIAGVAEYTLPGADGATGDVLTTNGSGLLSWETPSGGGSGATGPFTITSTGTNKGLIVSLGSGTGNAIECTSSRTPATFFKVDAYGNVLIDSDSGSGSTPLTVRYNGAALWSFAYTGDLEGGVSGQINIGGGLVRYHAAGGIAKISTFNELQFLPGALGGSGTRTVSVISGDAAQIPFAVKGAGSQSANLVEWKKSDDTIYSTISENGYFTTRKVAAPADAELSASEIAFWLDDTNGAGKLMVKAKTANGTVVTGNLVLA